MSKKNAYRIGKRFLMIIDNIGLHGFIQAYRLRYLVLIVKNLTQDCFLNRRVAKPITPSAKIARDVGAETGVVRSNATP